MERERPFIVEQKPPEQPKSTRQYERDEIRDDISAFPEEIQPIVQKFLDSASMTQDEIRSFQQARDDWWLEKYGFDHGDRAARNEFLLRKYAPSPELNEARQMQDEMFRAFQSGERAQIDDILIRYEQKYPEQLMGVTTLFEIVPYLKQTEELEYGLPHEQKMKLIENCTQDAFLLTHFVASNSDDKEFLRLFWSAAEKMAKDAGHLNSLNRLRKGILSQVAVKKIFAALGFNPRLSHPKEDAFHATDLWTEGGEAIQVKGHREGPAVVPTDTVSPVGVQVKDRNGERHFDSFLSNEMQKFRLRIDRYGKTIHRDIKGYLVRVPYSEFDAVTGEPTQKIIDFIRDELVAAGVNLERPEAAE
jgi:hypothetical protein